MRHHSSRIRRNTSTPNLRVRVDNFVRGRGRGRSRSPSPVIVERLYDESMREDFEDYDDYEPRATRNKSHVREGFSHGYGLYDELPSIRLSQSRSQGRLFGESPYEQRERFIDYERPVIRETSYGVPSFDGPSVDRRSYERPSYERVQLQIEDEERVNSRIYESGKRN